MADEMITRALWAVAIGGGAIVVLVVLIVVRRFRRNG
jgi:hypothetical protein